MHARVFFCTEIRKLAPLLPVCGFGFALAVRFNGRNCSWKSITSAIGPPSRRAGDAEIE